MDATSNFLARKLKEGLEIKREEMLRPLLNGSATDYADYKNRVGYLKALVDFEDMIAAISLAEDRRVYGAFGSDDDRSRSRPGTADY
jgi:hypothetical protein